MNNTHSIRFRSALLGWTVWGLVLAVGAGANWAGSLKRFEFTEPHMGVPVTVAFYTADEVAANHAAKAVYDNFERLNHALSDYRADSELSRLNKTSPHSQPVPISESFFDVLLAGQRLAEESGGAFDVTVGNYVRLWRRARRTKELPSPHHLAQAKLASGYQAVVLDERHKRVRLTKPGMRLDLGGIAMGYAVDQGLQILGELGIESAMIDASGDIGTSAAPPGTKGWKIGISPLEPSAPPSRYLLLEHGAITTSGDAYQFVEIDGTRYSHIVDPRTGVGVAQQSASTVFASTCMAADSLATALSVMGPKDGLALIDKTAGAAAIYMTVKNGRPTVKESSRWNTLRFAEP